jgi:predicted outer membrane repeat protein
LYNFGIRAPNLIDCRISGNAAANTGGGIKGPVTITSSLISQNTAGLVGGGLYNIGDLILTDSIVSGNQAAQDGGGIYITGSAILTNCTFVGNLAGRDGGGIFDCNSPTITACTFIENSADDDGGALYSFHSNPTLKNCVIAQNQALADGGGMLSDSSKPILVNCTFQGNSATRGAALAIDSSGDPNTVSITSCILWNGGREIWNNDGSALKITHSNIQGGWPNSQSINLKPWFADAPGGDYHLLSQAGRWHPQQEIWVSDPCTSPCIDTGDPNAIYHDELWPHGGRINMGAYGGTPQASMSPSLTGNIADLNLDGFVNLYDWILFTNKWFIVQVLLPEDMDRNNIVDVRDLFILWQNWLWKK